MSAARVSDDRKGIVATDPDAIAAFLSTKEQPLVRCGFEAGPLSPWLNRELARHDLPVVGG